MRKTVDENCKGVNIIIDIFSGTGAVSNTFLRIKCLLQMTCCIAITFPTMRGLGMRNTQIKK
ncbi:hypothetical protein [Mannheimia haemolytica]|uniref:hypothetical protein n=1 Tax=Mannheimia haemolytica TaxID=75985 RepID=UPI001EFB4F12|nr:hypothetical protein [Mannheimia haemolytica]